MRQIGFLLLLLLPVCITAQTGTVHDELSVHSDILDMDRKVCDLSSS